MVYPSDAVVEVKSGLTIAPPYGITFRFHDLGDVVTHARIRYSLKGSKGWKDAVIAQGNPYPNPTPDVDNQLTWTVPAVTTITTTAKIRIELLNAAGKVIGRDNSKVYFTILPPD